MKKNSSSASTKRAILYDILEDARGIVFKIEDDISEIHDDTLEAIFLLATRDLLCMMLSIPRGTMDLTWPLAAKILEGGYRANKKELKRKAASLRELGLFQIAVKCRPWAAVGHKLVGNAA